MIPKRLSNYFAKIHANIAMVGKSKNISKFLFFLLPFSQWNKIDNDICYAESLASFKSDLLKFIRPISNSIYNIHIPKGTQLLTRLGLG